MLPGSLAGGRRLAEDEVMMNRGMACLRTTGGTMAREWKWEQGCQGGIMTGQIQPICIPMGNEFTFSDY